MIFGRTLAIALLASVCGAIKTTLKRKDLVETAPSSSPSPSDVWDHLFSDYTCLDYCVGVWGECQSPNADDFSCYAAGGQSGTECPTGTTYCGSVQPVNDSTTCSTCAQDSSGPCVHPRRYYANANDPDADICVDLVYGVCPTGTIHCNSMGMSFLMDLAKADGTSLVETDPSPSPSPSDVWDHLFSDYTCLDYCVGAWGECQTPNADDFSCHAAGGQSGTDCPTGTTYCGSVQPVNDSTTCGTCAQDSSGPCVYPENWTVNSADDPATNICVDLVYGVCPTGTIHCNSMGMSFLMDLAKAGSTSLVEIAVATVPAPAPAPAPVGAWDHLFDDYTCLDYCVGLWGECQVPSADDFSCYAAGGQSGTECPTGTTYCGNVQPADDSTTCNACAQGSSGPCVYPDNWESNTGGLDPANNICVDLVYGVCPTGTIHCNAMGMTLLMDLAKAS